MGKKRDEKDRDEASIETEEDDRSESGSDAGEDSEDSYDRDESARGEGPDNLRRRSEWFQKRTGRR